jgi:hypothetical protein
MHLDRKNPAFAWTDGPLASTCITFVDADGIPFQVPRETLRLELVKAAAAGEEVPTFKQFMLQLHWFDGPRTRK